MKFLIGERGHSFLRQLDRWLGIPLTAPAAIYRKLTRPQRLLQAPANIGVICLGAIGDLILASALTDGIKKLHPQARLEIIASAANAAALPLNPHADAVYAAPVNRFARILRHIRAQHFDILIDTSQWARLGNLLCNLSGARLTAGFATPGQRRSTGYDTLCQHRSDCHELQNFLALGRALWPGLSGEPSLKLNMPPCGARDKIIYCHLWPTKGRGRKFKEWPLERWSELISQLLACGYQIRLTGCAEDAPACAEFLSRNFGTTPALASIAGKTSLAELAELFARATAVVSVNTGVMHLAAIAGTPTVGLHGATNPARWGPVGTNSISLLPRAGACAYLDLGFERLKNAKPAMAHLPVCDVLAALRKLNVPL